MGDKQRKLKDKASRLYADGKLKDALKLYVRVVEEDPTELQVQIKIGDIFKRLGNVEAAVDAYGPVARAYANDGLLLKAIAVCKMILAVDSDHAQTRALLSDLSAQRRGPPKAPFHRAPPVTLEGMHIAPAGAIELPSPQEGGMIELDPALADSASAPGGMRMLDPTEIGARPKVVTGQPEAPPPPIAGTPESPPPAAVWPAAGGQTPAPAVSWPGGPSAPAPDGPPWPSASGSPGAVRWPTAVAAEGQAPRIVVGEKVGSAPSEGPVSLDLELSASALPAVDPEPTPAPAGREREVLADQAAREVEAAMAGLSPGGDVPGEDEPLELPGDAEAPPEDAGLSLEFEDADASLEAAMAEAAASVDAPAAADPGAAGVSFPEPSAGPASDAEDIFGQEYDPLLSPTGAEGSPSELSLEDSELPIDLTDVVHSGDLAPRIGMPATSEDIRREDFEAQVLDPVEDGLGTPQIPLFSDLPKNAFIELLVEMEMHELSAGAVVVREGEVGDSFFVLVSGRVQVLRRDDDGQDVVLAHLTEGAFFGEMALLQDGARTATVLVEEDSQIFEISKEVLDRVVSRFPSVASVLRNFYRQRLLSTTMATHPLFRPFSVEERRSVMELFKSRAFKKGDVLVEEGKKGNGLFLLLYGALEVVKARDEATPKVLAELGSGDVFGEMSLLTGQPTVASVRAVTDCFVLRLAKKRFDELIMTHPQVLELISTISEERKGLNELILGQSGGTGAMLV